MLYGNDDNPIVGFCGRVARSTVFLFHSVFLFFSSSVHSVILVAMLFEGFFQVFHCHFEGLIDAVIKRTFPMRSIGNASPTCQCSACQPHFNKARKRLPKSASSCHHHGIIIMCNVQYAVGTLKGRARHLQRTVCRVYICKAQATITLFSLAIPLLPCALHSRPAHRPRWRSAHLLQIGSISTIEYLAQLHYPLAVPFER